MLGDHEAAVVGLGVLCPGATSVDDFWAEARTGASHIRSSVGAIEQIGPVAIAGAVPETWDPKTHLTHPETRRTDRATQLGIHAAMEANIDAGWSNAGPEELRRTAIVVGTGLGGMVRPFEEAYYKVRDKGFMRMNPLLVPMVMPNATAAWLSLKLGITGPTNTITLACSSGTAAIGEGARLVASGIVDRALVGGTEALLHPWTIAAFARMEALSTRNDDPEAASRPFDADRDGFVMGEGAGFLALERADLAAERGATVRARVAGYGNTSDAFHLVAPHETGAGAAASMTEALTDAGIGPEDVGHVNAHGTSTDLNDRVEAEAIGQVFGETRVPVTSLKGMIGHLVGAAGGVEGVAAVLAAESGVIPPTANHERLGEGIDLDVVAGAARPGDPAPVLSNSFAFGGHNTSIVITP